MRVPFGVRCARFDTFPKRGRHEVFSNFGKGSGVRFQTEIKRTQNRMSIATRLRRTLFPLKLGEVVLVEGRQLAPAIVITGGSEGLGKAFGLHLAERSTVVLIARHEADLAAAAADIRPSNGQSDVRWLAIDVSAEDAPARIREFLNSNDLYLDVLINNAGTASGGRFDLLDRPSVMKVIDVNIRGLVALTHAFLPDMRARQTGGIINLASVAAFTPGPWQSLYFASKSFVLSFSLAVAQENRDVHIPVMAAAPGPVETNIHQKMRTGFTWYRRLFPSWSAETCAAAIWQAFERGQDVFVPGAINSLAMIAGKILPHELMVPITSWLVRPRFRSGRAAD
jgi:short-subunit dehydrogenase